MGLSPFEIQRLLKGGSWDSDSPSSLRRQSRFPRTARLRTLLIGVVALALVVFGLNLIQNSLIPSAEVIGRGEESKDCREGSAECHDATISDTTNTAADDDDDQGVQNVAIQNGGQTQSTSMLAPTQRPIAVPNTVPTPMLRPGSAPPASPGQEPLLPTEPSIGSSVTQQDVPSPSSPTDVQNVVPDFTYPEALVPIMNDASQTFVETWCDLDGTDWYPKGDNAWKKRAPAFLIPGAKYSGIFAITKLLEEHPQIRPPSTGPETRFFFEPGFLRYVKPNEKTTVMQARERLLATNYPAQDFRKTQGDISYDASSGYLFRSSVLPRRLLCVLPWIKIVVVLRDPIERLYAHYQAMKFDHSLPHQLEDWIERDMSLMKQAKLIRNAAASAVGKTNMTEEDFAWYDYQHNAVEGPVGRSLYDIQLRQWFQALRAIGRNPKDSVLIVRTEDLVKNPQHEFDRILNFLDLSSFAPSSWEIASSITAKKPGAMSEETEKMLEDFFKPYQARLKKLLKRFKVPYGSNFEVPTKR